MLIKIGGVSGLKIGESDSKCSTRICNTIISKKDETRNMEEENMEQTERIYYRINMQDNLLKVSELRSNGKDAEALELMKQTAIVSMLKNMGDFEKGITLRELLYDKVMTPYQPKADLPSETQQSILKTRNDTMKAFDDCTGINDSEHNICQVFVYKGNNTMKSPSGLEFFMKNEATSRDMLEPLPQQGQGVYLMTVGITYHFGDAHRNLDSIAQGLQQHYDRLRA